MPRDLPVTSQSDIERHVVQLVQSDLRGRFSLNSDETAWPVFISLLGSFRLLQAGQPVSIRGNSKASMLLGALALRNGRPIAREALLNLFWPDTEDTDLAGQALHSLVRDLHKRLRANLGSVRLVVPADGHYRLNSEAGVGVDVAIFDALVTAGEQQVRAHNLAAAVTLYKQALTLYRGDLCVDTDVYACIQKEYLRGRYLTLLAWMADYHYRLGDYAESLAFVRRLLASDPCREDAHRLAMHCYMRLGERTQALRHYHLCVTVLQADLMVYPESETVALFEQIRRDPRSI